jgi:predicted alpha/beta-fold hydrolase
MSPHPQYGGIIPPRHKVDLPMLDNSPRSGHGSIIESGFRPHPLLRNAHIQTMGPALLRPTPQVNFRRETLTLPDGDFLVLGHAGPDSDTAPRVLMLHGLTGGLESKYLCGLTQQMLPKGWACIAVQQRGAGPRPNRLPRSYNHGASDDIAWLLQEIRGRHPKAPLFAVGWSLGGNVLLKTLGELGDAAPLDGAIAVSVPFRLEPCVDHLRKGFARVYQRHMLRALQRSLRNKHGPVPLPPDADLAAALVARDFREFDNAYTAACNDYADADDYYARAACGQYLRDVAVPTHVIHALDDPFMTPDIVPSEDQLSPSVTLELSPLGGHVGFVEADHRRRPALWLERYLPVLLETRLCTQPDVAAAELTCAPATT